MKFRGVLAAVIIIRLLLFNLPSFHIDMSLWQAWSARINQVGPINFYSSDYFSDYFPGFLYILWIIGGIYNLLFPHLTFNTFLFEVFIKSTTTFFDLATGFYIYKIVSRYQKSWAQVSSILYIANPAVIFNASVWGQIDGIFTFFLVFGVYKLLEIKDIKKTNIYLALALLVKPQSLAIFPAILSKLFNTDKFRSIKNMALIIIVLTTLSLPFFINDPFFGLFRLGAKVMNVYPYNSLFAFNFWSLFGWWKPDTILLFGITYRNWGIILYFMMTFLVLLPFFLKKLKDNFHFYLSCAICFFTFYFFLTRMHERYLFPFFAFILIAAFVRKSKSLILIYLISTVIYFLNLYYVYIYYNFVYAGIKINNSLYNLVDNNYKLFSLAFFLIYFWILIIYYRYLQLLNQK